MSRRSSKVSATRISRFTQPRSMIWNTWYQKKTRSSTMSIRSLLVRTWKMPPTGHGSISTTWTSIQPSRSRESWDSTRHRQNRRLSVRLDGQRILESAISKVQFHLLKICRLCSRHLSAKPTSAVCLTTGSSLRISRGRRLHSTRPARHTGDYLIKISISSHQKCPSVHWRRGRKEIPAYPNLFLSEAGPTTLLRNNRVNIITNKVQDVHILLLALLFASIHDG